MDLIKTCKALKKDGQPCNGYAGFNSDFCFTHDPAKVTQRKQARAAGGKKSRPSEYTERRETERSLEGVYHLIWDELESVLTLEKSIARARAIGYLAGIVVDIFQVSELENRLRILEQAITQGGDQ